MGLDPITAIGGGMQILGSLFGGKKSATQRLQESQYRRYMPMVNAGYSQIINSGGMNPFLAASGRRAEADINTGYQQSLADLMKRTATNFGGNSMLNSQSVALARARGSDLAGARYNQLGQQNANVMNALAALGGNVAGLGPQVTAADAQLENQQGELAGNLGEIARWWQELQGRKGASAGAPQGMFTGERFQVPQETRDMMGGLMGAQPPQQTYQLTTDQLSALAALLGR